MSWTQARAVQAAIIGLGYWNPDLRSHEDLEQWEGPGKEAIKLAVAIEGIAREFAERVAGKITGGEVDELAKHFLAMGMSIEKAFEMAKLNAINKAINAADKDD